MAGTSQAMTKALEARGPLQDMPERPQVALISTDSGPIEYPGNPFPGARKRAVSGRKEFHVHSFA